VTALTNNRKAGPLEGLNRLQMGDAGEFSHQDATTSTYRISRSFFISSATSM
jgi:hypothetical protein